MQHSFGIVYNYYHPNPSFSHTYLWPVVKKVLSSDVFSERRAFEIGCGQGATANMLAEFGFSVTGVDPSETGIDIARKTYGHQKFFVASSEDDLAAAYGAFPLVVALEVLPCVFEPVLFAKRVFELLEPNGIAIVSAPYHGYAKNLALSLANKWDSHLDPFWPGTAVRFFSGATFVRLWSKAGFREINVVKVGRIPMFAKSMVGILRKSGKINDGSQSQENRA